MENHPIPQDVTGFKFKLIGSVTVKQFLYLLAFGILATVCFVLKINPFIKFPLMFFFGGIGAALAFVPIEGRPMDVMIANFAKAIPAENRFIFRKRGANLSEIEAFRPIKITSTAPIQAKQTAQENENQTDYKKAMLLKRLRNSTGGADDAEIRKLSAIKNIFVETPTASISMEGIPQARPSPVQISADTEPTVQILQNEPVTPIEENKPVVQEEIEVAKTEDKGVKIEESKIEEKGNPEESKPAENQMPQTLPIGAPAEEKEDKNPIPQTVVSSSPAPSLPAGFPSLPDVPNIVMGIIRDPRGKTIPNVLVEVVDANSTPVRAFKTNALGQFASATPLSAGNYKVFLSDPQKNHEFEPIELTLTDQIFNPLEITSVDSREKLRRELFGQAPLTA